MNIIKGFVLLLRVIDIYSKYASIVPLKNEKILLLLILDELNPKPSKT